MTTKLSSGRTRMKRSAAALGIAGLVFAGLATPALADVDDEETGNEESSQEDSTTEDSDGSGEQDPQDPEGSADSESAQEEEPAAPAMALMSAASSEVVIDLVGINDFHGRLDAGLKVEGGAITTEGAGVRLAAAVEEARANNPNTLFVGAGDLYSASTFTSMAGDDVPTTDMFNAIGMDTSSVGNHEFDYGFANLQDRIAGNGDYAGHAISWEYLGANVYLEGTTNAVLPEYIIYDVDGVEIAFIGLVTEETPSLVTPAGIAGLEFGDPTEAVTRVINDNTDVQDADTIVILTHDGGVNGEAVEDVTTHFGAFAKNMADRGDIAGIFSGHTHTKYEVDLDVPTTQSLVGNMPVIQTGSFGDNLGLISLTFDVDDDGNASLTNAESDMTALSGVSVPAEGTNSVVDEVRDIVMAAVAEADAIGADIIGEAGADLLRATHVDPQTGNPGENRGGQSTISNLIADAQLWAVHDQAATDDLPVIAFMNPGGVRTDIPQGPVTYKQVADVQPFANTLETLDLTGAQIKQILEEQWQPDGSSRPFLKLGISDGFFYTYDPTADRGERVTSMTLDGDEIDLSATYRVVTNNFLASGGDNFFTLGQGTNYSDTGLVDLQAFVDYFRDVPVVHPDYAKRALGVTWITDPDAVYTPGDDVELDVSSLLFSNDEPGPSEIVAVLKDPSSGEAVEVGRFDVDDEVVNTNDETGRATIAFTVPDLDSLPEGSEGWVLSLLDEGELFHATLPIQVMAGEGGGEETPVGILDITPVKCEVTLTLGVPGAGDFALEVWDDGEKIDSTEWTSTEPETKKVTWEITGPIGDVAASVGFYFIGPGGLIDDVDPWEYPTDSLHTCSHLAGGGDDGEGETPKPGGTDDGILDETGADVAGLATVGALLLAAGAATMLVRRRVMG